MPQRSCRALRLAVSASSFCFQFLLAAALAAAAAARAAAAAATPCALPAPRLSVAEVRAATAAGRQAALEAVAQLLPSGAVSAGAAGANHSAVALLRRSRREGECLRESPDVLEPHCAPGAELPPHAAMDPFVDPAWPTASFRQAVEASLGPGWTALGSSNGSRRSGEGGDDSEGDGRSTALGSSNGSGRSGEGGDDSEGDGRSTPEVRHGIKLQKHV